MAAAAPPPPTLRRIKLGSQGLEVSAQGLGCHGFTPVGGPPKPEPHVAALLRHAVRHGVTLLDTADVYGGGDNEAVVGTAVREGGLREQVQLATKFGFVRPTALADLAVRGDPAYVRAACEPSLRRLGVDCIDLYYIEELKKLVEEGRIRYIGLSEASASTIRRAHAVHPISTVQLEWSLWSREVEEDIVPTCRELGIGIVAYSPLGRGFFASGPRIVGDFSERLCQTLPRFYPENLEHNTHIFEQVQEMSTRKGCTPSQLALAWLHHQGNDVCPIPGTTKIENLNQNLGALSVKLTPEEKAELESFAAINGVKGDRFFTSKFSWRESETPPLSSWKHE